MDRATAAPTNVIIRRKSPSAIGEKFTKHTAIVVTLAFAFMAGAAWRERPWWEYAFISDGSAVAWLSSALLIANAAVALALTLSRVLPVTIGGSLAAALTLLGVDEQFQLHEQFKQSVGIPFGEAPTLLIGVGAIVVLRLLWGRLPTRTVRVLFGSAVSVGVFALWVDLGSPPLIVGQLEEAFEVLAESLFLCGLLELGPVQVQLGDER